MAKQKADEHVESVRTSLAKWVQSYSSARKEKWCGEFIGPDEIENPQYGLGGSAMVSFLERDFPDPKPDAKYRLVFQRIGKALEKQASDPSQLTEDEAKIIKDVPRAIVKAILLSLSDEKFDSQPTIATILQSVDGNGLFRSIQDDPKSDGDALITAIVIIFIHISGRVDGNRDALAKPEDKLKIELSSVEYDLYQKLIISNALCLIDYNKHIWDHIRLLDKLYVSDLDWWRSFSSPSPFTEKLYSDAPVKDNRYLKIPNGFTVLLAIYLALGSERRLYSFPPSARLLEDIRAPFREHVGKDKAKASVYYVFYTYVALNLDRFFGSRKVHVASFVAQYLYYKFRNLTAVGLIVLSLLISSVLYLSYLVYSSSPAELVSQLGTVISTVGVFLSSLLGLRKTSRR